MAVLAAHHGVLDLFLAPNITFNFTENTISASWNVDLDAVQYSAYLTGPNLMRMSQNTTDTIVIFTNLVPATPYTLTVEGADNQDRNGDPAIVNITTGRTGELTGAHAVALRADYQCVF